MLIVKAVFYTNTATIYEMIQSHYRLDWEDHLDKTELISEMLKFKKISIKISHCFLEIGINKEWLFILFCLFSLAYLSNFFADFDSLYFVRYYWYHYSCVNAHLFDNCCSIFLHLYYDIVFFSFGYYNLLNVYLLQCYVIWHMLHIWMLKLIVFDSFFLILFIWISNRIFLILVTIFFSCVILEI